MKSIFILSACLLLGACVSKEDSTIGETSITQWKDNKLGAISITFDDATINQFRYALPILDSLGFKGTFFINTGDIPGSTFPPRYFGKPLKDVITSAASSPTTQENLFERASALRFVDIENAIGFHNQAGSLYEQGELDQAYHVIDSAYAIAVKKKSYKEVRPVLLTGDVITWPEIIKFAERGHEFGNHTITHPRLAVLDEANLRYEIEKCKEEILLQLGEQHTFSAECPFGTEDERVMQYAYKIHPALRNRMPEPFLEELNRSSDKTPSSSKKEYVQWQRGPLQNISLDVMKSYVDTLLVHDNTWLVLTFHGVDGIGWEAKPHEELQAYFSYMKQHNDKLWVATFGDVTKYMRERMKSSLIVEKVGDKIKVQLNHALDPKMYAIPLTLKTYVDPTWTEVTVRQGDVSTKVPVLEGHDKKKYVVYDVAPNGEPTVLSKGL